MNKKILILIIICILITISPSYAFGRKKIPDPKENTKIIVGAIEENTFLSLDDCIKLALEHNPSIETAKQNAAVYKTKIGQARSNYVPEFSISSGYSKNNALMNSTMPKSFDRNTNNYVLGSISASQLLYDFGKTSANVNVQKMNYKSSEADLSSKINNVIFSVKEAYYYLLLTLDQEKVTEESVLQYDLLLEQAQAFYDIGIKAKIDVTIARTNLSKVTLSLIKAQNAVSLAKVKLNKAMGLLRSPEYSLNESLTFNTFEINSDDLWDTAYKSRPEVISAQAQLEVAKSLRKLSKKAVIPELKANGQYSIGGEDFTADKGWSAGINLEIPTFNPYKTKKLVDEAKATEQREIASLEEVKQNIYIEVQQSYISYVESKQSVPVSEQSVKQAQENYELASGRYKAGLGTPIEFKEAEVMHRNAKMDYLKALYNYNVAIANIEKVIGEQL